MQTRQLPWPKHLPSTKIHLLPSTTIQRLERQSITFFFCCLCRHLPSRETPSHGFFFVVVQSCRNDGRKQAISTVFDREIENLADLAKTNHVLRRGAGHWVEEIAFCAPLANCPKWVWSVSRVDGWTELYPRRPLVMATCKTHHPEGSHERRNLNSVV